MRHLILVGATYLDTILTVPHFPEEDSKLRASSLQVRRGGNCANSLEVLQQLLPGEAAVRAASAGSGSLAGSGHGHGPEVALHLVSCLPRKGSAGTAKILASFGADTPVDFGWCLFREGHDEPASSYVVRSTETGSRTIVNYNDLPEMSFDEFVDVADAFAGTREDTWWHFEGRNPETTLQCIKYLRHKMPNCTVSVEVEKPNREGLIDLAALANVVFYSKTWAESRGYAGAAECVLGEAPPQASLAVCTWGAQGACALALPGQDCVSSCPAATGPDFKVIDTVGAGDTFIAGMLYGLVYHADDWDTAVRLRFAVDLATKKIQTEGFARLGPVQSQGDSSSRILAAATAA